MFNDIIKNDKITKLTKKDIDFEKSLMDLLCIIHRDGGHYINRHEMEKAIKDAKRIASEAIVKS